MISGVIFFLAGEAAVLRSLPHLTWTLTFIVINLTYISLLEEPLTFHISLFHPNEGRVTAHGKV